MKSCIFESCLLRCAFCSLIASLIAGCAAPVALLANPDKDFVLRYVKPAGFKLTSIKIVWIENPSIDIDYRYQAPNYLVNTSASPEMVKKIKDEAQHLITVLHTEVPVKLLKSLEKSGVQVGDDYRIEMKPMSINHLDNHLGTTAHIDVRILNREGKILWATPVFAKRGYNVIGIDFANQDSAYIDNVIQTLLIRMRKAELISS